MLAGFGKFVRGYDDLSATASAAFLCGLQTGTCSFPDQIALELCQRAEQVEDQATAGCRGVDVWGLSSNGTENLHKGAPWAFLH